jgi:hypothetical protein
LEQQVVPLLAQPRTFGFPVNDIAKVQINRQGREKSTLENRNRKKTRKGLKFLLPFSSCLVPDQVVPSGIGVFISTAHAFTVAAGIRVRKSLSGVIMAKMGDIWVSGFFFFLTAKIP